jgi:putative membrane protein
VVRAATGRVAAAHEGAPVAPHDAWSAWTLDPALLVGLGVAGWLHARGVRALWRRAGRGAGVGGWRVSAYAAGLAALAVALVSPLDALGGVLLSAHMLQHLVLILVAAPLLVLGGSTAVFLWALPGSWRRPVGALRRARPARLAAPAWRAAIHPLGAAALHAAVLWAWHLPGPYQAALAARPLHALEHVAFVATAALFWSVVARCGSSRGLDYGLGGLYVFAVGMQGGVLGALMALSPEPWYPAYRTTAAAWGFSPLADQRLAGMLMWLPAGVAYLAAAALLFGRWASREQPAPSRATGR